MTTADAEEERTLRPIVQGAPTLLSYDPPVYAAYFGNANDAFDAAVAAERLSFGWEVVAYFAPVGDEFQREWRVTAWREVESDCGPWVTKEEPADA